MTGFRRTRLLGLDLLTITEASLIESVDALPEVDRVAAVQPDPGKLPWLFRWFFPKTRFYNSALRGWFLPFRGASDPTYAPCRAFLDEAFANPCENGHIVVQTADLLADPACNTKDRQLADVAVRAIWTYLFPKDCPALPDTALAAAFAQLGDVTDSFMPLRVLRGVPGTASVYSYIEGILRDRGLLSSGAENRETGVGAPPELVTDVAHVLFAMAKNAPRALRRVGELRDGEDVRAALCALGPVDSVPRMVSRDSTLGGLLPGDDPARAGATVVLLGLRDAAAETGSSDFVFGCGPGARQSAARGAIERYFSDVRDELLRRRVGSAADSAQLRTSRAPPRTDA